MRPKYKSAVKFLPGRIRLVDASPGAARKAIIKHHYSRTTPAAPLNVYWICAGRKVIGVITLGVGCGATRRSVPKRLFGRNIHHRQWRTVERLILFPQWNGGNVISQTFSQLFRLAELSGWRFIHTVADERAGYGAGYRASNFTPVGSWIAETFGDLSKTRYKSLGVLHKVSYQATAAFVDRGKRMTGKRTKIIASIYRRTRDKRFEHMLRKIGGRLLRLRQHEYVRVIDPSLALLPKLSKTCKPAEG